MLRVVALLLGLVLASPVTAFELTGTWQGDLDTPIGKLKLVLHVTETEDGYSGKLDSPDQGAIGLPIDEVTFDGKTLRFSTRPLKLSFRGSVDEERIVGRVKQRGERMRLALSRAKMVEVARPQNPMPPYPYEQEDIALKFSSGRVLAGTLVLPDQFSTAVVLINGSGQQDRDSTVMQHKLFLVLADHLARQGIASFRYDDRGVGESTGDATKATTADFAEDLYPVIGYLRQRLQVGLGLIGHSEGALIGAMVAAATEIDYLVTLAGSTINGVRILDAQNRALFAASAPEHIERRFEILNTVNKMVVDDQEGELNDYLKTAYRGLSKKELVEIGLPPDRKQLIQISTLPWMKYFLSYEPRPALAKLELPVLAVFGSSDMQVPATVNEAGLAEVLTNKKSQVKTFPDKNHLFQTEPSGQPSQYFRTEETMSPEVMDFVAEWISAVSNETTLSHAE